jgi:hypothetical protein
MRPLALALAVASLLACGSPPSPREAAARPASGGASRSGPPRGEGVDGGAIAPDLGKIDDGAIWTVINGVAAPEREGERRAVRLGPKGGNTRGSNVGLALVNGVEFDEGTIDVDLKGQGGERASFVGIVFGAEGGATYEAVYFRPFNFKHEDPARRAHGVQYIAWPGHTWESLRARAPGVYEAAVDPVPDPAGWFHARVEVAKTQVRVFVNDAKAPCLVVERLGRAQKGRVGLWVDSQDGSFAGLIVRRNPPTSGAP